MEGGNVGLEEHHVLLGRMCRELPEQEAPHHIMGGCAYGVPLALRDDREELQ